ncbi:MAG TPA: transcriptional regulator [Rhizobiales bacterium]|nr:transcriptional regulator [Hyphomicrobiales bacterium]
MVTHRESNTREEELVEATLKCIATHGLGKTTVRKIAETAGVTNGLIRFYFTSKDKIIQAAYIRLLNVIFRTAFDDMEGSDLKGCERLGSFIRANLSSSIISPDMVSLWASFLPLAQNDPVMAEIRRKFNKDTVQAFETLISDAYKECDLSPTKEQISQKAFALNSLIDGIWINGGMPDSELCQKQLVEIGFSSAAALLELPKEKLFPL